MSIWNNYHIARTIQDALSVLQNATTPVRLIGGGTDLLLDVQQGRSLAVDTLVDVTRVPELTCLEERAGELFVGAAVPLNKVTTSALVQKHAQALVEAAGLIGGPQVRNTATLGGNVAHALPAGDGTISLVALDAQAEIASPDGLRRAPILELFRGPGQTTLDAMRELLVGFYLPLSKPGQASGFSRVMRPQGVAIAILNMGAWIERDGPRIGRVRVSIGPAGPVPRRSAAAETVLAGKEPNIELFDEAHHALLEEVTLRTSPHRATKEYRQQVSRFLLEEVVMKAWLRAEAPAGRE